VAKLVENITFGIDVSKDSLLVFDWQAQESFTLVNEPQAIGQWLDSLPLLAQIAVEPTAHYHRMLVDAALSRTITIYLIDQRQLVHYREAVNVRNKTDLDDAQLLARYLVREHDQLRPFRPHSRKAQRLWELILRRGTVVQCRQRVQQSFAEVQISVKAVITQLNALLLRLQQQILCLIRELGWAADYHYCRSIPGIGLDNAAALTAAYHRGAFAGADAFVAYLGLDIRLRESGKYRGKRKLTKRGEAEIRRLLFCASRGATCYQPFAQYLKKKRDEGHPKIATRMMLGRKLVRIAFTLMTRQEMFVRKEIATG
jgi:transposase